VRELPAIPPAERGLLAAPAAIADDLQALVTD
jgi:hypothetical protein